MITMIKHSLTGDGEITLRVDPEQMSGVVNGCLWFGVTDGKPQFLSRLNPLPPARDDDKIMPFFDGGSSYKMIDFDAKRAAFSPTFEIQHLCGYDYTPEGYTHQAELLESFGFECLRSRRHTDGKYWEVWRLLGYWSAKGDLAAFCDCVDSLADAKKIEAVVRWLCEHCSFGTLDVTTQRAAQVID